MNPSTASAIVIRPAVREDHAAVRVLFEAHLAGLGYQPDPELDADMTDWPAAYPGEGHSFLIAVGPDQRPVAMGGIREGEIRRIYVAPEYRGRGLARSVVLQLLQAAIQAGQQDFRAIVSRRNEYMRQVFQACGFLPTGLAPEHLKMRECEILLLARPRDRARATLVITGGSRGLGRHLVNHFSSRFNVVFGWWKSEEAAFDLAREQATRGRWVWPIRVNVADWERMQFLADMVATVAGPCQALIHTTGRFSLQPFARLDPATWRAELDTTVTGGFHAWRAFAGQLTSHARARVIFIGDSAAEQLRARRQSTAYYVGKHGLILLARTIASENQKTGLTCNVVSPGVLPNSIDLDQPGMAANVDFEEVAGAIDFLLGASADSVSGSHLIASHGWNM